MTVCPFCKAPVSNAHRPCPQCGRNAADHPSIAAVQGRTLSTDFDDDDPGGLDLEQGSAVGHGHGASASYDGGGLTLDDDFLDDGPPPGGLELDVPMGHTATRDRAPPTSEPRLEVPDLDTRTSGTHAAVPRGSGAHPAAPSLEPPPSSPHAPASGPSSSRQPVSGPLPTSSGRLPAAPPSSSGSLPAAPSSSPHGMDAPPSDPGPPPPPPPPDPAAIVAKYPPAPEKIWQAPGYALRVLWRQFELRQDLESLRRRRSPDVPLYERALKAHDRRSFTVGLAITSAGLVIATFVFFLPVILRFINAP